MKRLLIITAAGIVALLCSPALLVMATIALFSKKFRDWASFRIMLAKASFEPGQPLTPIEPEGEVIDTPGKLKVSTYIKITTTNDLRLLIKSGEATPERLAKAWSDITGEVYERAGGEGAKEYMALQKKMLSLKLRIETVYRLCDALSMAYDPEFIEKLRSYGYARAFTVDSYQKDIDRVRTGEKRFLSIYNKTVKEFENRFKGSANKQTEADLYNTIEELRKHGNYQDDPYTLAEKWYVDTYCLLLARLNEHNKRQMDQITKQNLKKKKDV